MTPPAKLLLGITLAAFGCDAVESDDDFRSTAPPAHPLQGVWEGLSPHVSDTPTSDHETLIIIEDPAHATDPHGRFARYEYPNLLNPVVCSSVLHDGEVETDALGNLVYYFDDDTQTAPQCVDGTVTLSPTDDPNIIDFQWIDGSGNVDNEGPLYRRGSGHKGGGAG